jgi:Cu/Ag efflux protein CusF
VLPAVYADGQALSEGEIRKVDRNARKITIRHGPLPNLDMPPMTMVFQVKDPALLDQARAGDKVSFRAEKEAGVYFVTELKPAK